MHTWSIWRKWGDPIGDNDFLIHIDSIKVKFFGVTDFNAFYKATFILIC